MAGLRFDVELTGEPFGATETEAERFASNYRKAGGEMVLEYFDAPSLFATIHPTLPESIQALDDIVAFVHQHIPVEN